MFLTIKLIHYTTAIDINILLFHVDIIMIDIIYRYSSSLILSSKKVALNDCSLFATPLYHLWGIASCINIVEEDQTDNNLNEPN